MVTIPVKTLSGGFSLPVYGLGTWGMGGWLEADMAHDGETVAAIADALAAGVKHIDTAEMYGAGHAEELVGGAVQGFDRRKLQIASKVYAGLDGGYDGVLRACEASLKRLGTDYLDLYMLHRMPARHLDDVMRAMDRLVAEGAIRAIGVCNMTAHRFEEVQRRTANKVVCNQLHYSVDCREIVQKGVLAQAQSHDVMVTAWGPLGKGTLEQQGMLQEVAAKYGKTPYQVALNWLITQQNVVVVSKTSSLTHLQQNLGALGWQLEHQDWQRIADEFPNQKLISDRVPLDYPAEIEP